MGWVIGISLAIALSFGQPRMPKACETQGRASVCACRATTLHIQKTDSGGMLAIHCDKTLLPFVIGFIKLTLGKEDDDLE